MSEKKNKIQQTQSALRLLEALSGIDEELLLRSDTPDTLETIVQRNEAQKVTNVSGNRKHRRSIVAYRNAVAACIGFVVVGVLSWNALRPIWAPKGADSSSNETADDSWKLANEQSAYDLEINPEDGPTGIAEGAADEFDGSEVTGDVIKDIETKREDCGGAEDILTECENDTGRSSEASGDTSNAEKEIDQNLMSTASPRMELTEAEARNTAVVGAFIPDNIPKGYTFETAYYDSQGAVTIIWHHRMNSILINVSQVVAEDFATVDVDRTETYDVWLYEIPYGETVPSEYIETFQNPVFKWEDMNLKIVNSRMKSVGDTGDTATPRGSFSVLYPEGVLLYFNGRGTAEEIWDMLSSIGK